MTLYRAIRSELVKLRHTPLLPIHIFVPIAGAIRTFTVDSIRSKQDNHFLRKVSCPFWWRRSFTD